jgi:hypothetical protein
MLQTINRFSEPYPFHQGEKLLFSLKSSFEHIVQKNDYLGIQNNLVFENPTIFVSREGRNSVCATQDYVKSFIHIDSLRRKITPDIEIKLSDKTFRLPFAFNDLKAEIEASKYILELEEEWGEDGEKYDIHVWEIVFEFIIKMYLTSVRMFDVIPDFPKIYHGPDGTIDIVWEKSDYQILVNCPKEENRQVSFYGENVKKDSFKGSFYITDNCHSLLMILIGIKICGI